MSEGINFSDGLGRCVIVVGMPFPNINSPEIAERMAYINSLSAPNRKGPSAAGDKSAGDEYYENLCMKAVNQSIGRAIRHSSDYAVIMLLDSRYSRPAIRAKLPGWIGGRVEAPRDYGAVHRSLCEFFRSKRANPATI
eukprot:Opistho-2@85371